jgi:hypothetical protein
MSSKKYVKNAITKVKAKLQEVRLELAHNITSPMSNGYQPEMDLTLELDDN